MTQGRWARAVNGHAEFPMSLDSGRAAAASATPGDERDVAAIRSQTAVGNADAARVADASCVGCRAPSRCAGAAAAVKAVSNVADQCCGSWVNRSQAGGGSRSWPTRLARR